MAAPELNAQIAALMHQLVERRELPVYQVGDQLRVIAIVLREKTLLSRILRACHGQ